MGSQALEILRQGVWASATGGWFYDPHQSAACNTAHLYLWLLLLCLPFTVYLYFPPSICGWCVYIGLVAILFAVIKLLNFALHHMYDTSECIIVPSDNTAPPEKRRMQKRNRQDEDIELQMLRSRHLSTRSQSDNESVISLECQKPNSSTIDLKVDVHRKNSSESSAEGASLRAVVGAVTVQHAERTQQSDITIISEASTSGSGHRPRSRPARRRWTKQQNRDNPNSNVKIEELSSEEGLRMEFCSKTEDAVAVNIDYDLLEDSSKCIPSLFNDQYDQIITNTKQYLSKFARQLSSDSRDNSELSINGFQISPVKKKANTSQQCYFNVYPVESCTKSAIALTQPSQTPQSSAMRRNSNSTMSTIQLPIVSSAHLVTRVRRHSNVTNASFGFLPTGSVELGAYMLEKTNNEGTGSKKKTNTETRMPGVRRIKSAALEIGCPPPSVSNLSPHPNSVETIGGQVLKNPKSAIIPPPSKSLIRNPHLNLWPKNITNSADGNSLPYMSYGSEIVYPIAEISDEMQTSQCQESDLESLSSQCGSDYEDDKVIIMKPQLRGFDSDFNQPLEANSSDTEYENNGSRSPLLDRNECIHDIKIVKCKSEKCDLDSKKQSNLNSKGLLKNNSFCADSKSADKLKYDRNKKLLKNNSFNTTMPASEEISNNIQVMCDESGTQQCSENLVDNSEIINNVKNYKQKSNKSKTFENSDIFDKTSACSKDLLLEKSSVDSNECLMENFEKHKEKIDQEKEIKRLTDLEISNSSDSLEMQDARQEIGTETSDISDQKTLSDTHSKDASPPLLRDDSEHKLQSDENSIYGMIWLFDESNHQNTEPVEKDVTVENFDIDKPSCSHSESTSSYQRNLGAIPKQLKNITRTRASSLKENKKLEKSKDREKSFEGPTQEELETAEAHSALVQGLECLFAASKTNTVVMPPLNRDDRPRCYRQQLEHRRDNHKPRKKSIEEMAQTSTNTILPTSMPLLAAFLNSRVDYPHVPIYLPGETDPGPSCSDTRIVPEGTYEFQRARPLVDRNHRYRVRKTKRNARNRCNEPNQPTEKIPKEINKNLSNSSFGASSSNVHFATSFEDTSDGAIHCFMDEHGNWMSYTFDKNSSCCHAIETDKNSQVKSIETTECQAESPGLAGSCVSIDSKDLEISNKSKNSDSLDHTGTNESICNSPSNEGSNNPLLSSNNNSTSTIPSLPAKSSSRSKANEGCSNALHNNSAAAIPPLPPKVNSRSKTNENSNNPLISNCTSSTSTISSVPVKNNSRNNANDIANNTLIVANDSACVLPPLPPKTNSRNKAMYVMESAIPSRQNRPPLSVFTDSLLDRVELHHMVPTNMPINFMNPNPAACLVNDADHPAMLHLSSAIPMSSSIADSLDLSQGRNKSRLPDSLENTNENQPMTYYKFKILNCWKIKVTMDRLKLMALFDRNLTLKETYLSITLGILVSILGALVLHMGFYKDIWAFWFCFVMAGSQYSLLKSVQPDSASPIHGFNRMVAFSRPVYFCLYSALLCTIHHNLGHQHTNGSLDSSSSALSNAIADFSLYGMNIKSTEILTIMENVISVFLLFFPLAFSFGLFPQVNTFAMYLFEQIDIHIYGGNATASLSASLYCLSRSTLAIAVLYGFAYGGLTESKGSQHILFSMFCGLIVPISYHLSRCASDYVMIWNLLKSHLIPSDLYAVHGGNSNSNLELEKQSMDVQSDKNSKTKTNSEDNVSKQPSIGSSTSKMNLSSDTNISKVQKRSQTSVNSSVNSLRMDSKACANLHSSNSIKLDTPADDKSENKVKTPNDNEDEMEDPLPKKLQETVNSRFKNDIIICSFMALFIFGIHCTTVFSTLQPEFNPILRSIAGLWGWALHYLIPQFRKQLPWLWLSSPVLKAHEHAEFEVREPAKIMWFEKIYVYLCFFEKNILYPVVFISAVTQDSPQIILKFGPGIGALIICVCAVKCLRNSYSDPDNQYLILLFAELLFKYDYYLASETFLIDYFLMGIIFNKTYEFLLKIQFVVTYIAPWQITWGSAFHAFAQPFSVPHSAMLFLQAAISAILSTPLNPILGSAIFISSYVRPVKFWERDYNTKRVDQSNTRLSSQLERNLGSDDNNLNSIFYEHLTRSLQHYLCGDLMLGRWGQVQQGDCFVLTSDSLNCLVHIVEMGNGLVSFQLRGLEFRGTYCQQREVEAITEGPEENDGCCCCAVGHLPGMLSVNAMFSLRWLAWQLTTARYVLEGYSISDNSAISMLQVFDFRKVLISYYVKSIIFYTIQSPKLEEWLSSPSILEALKPTLDRNFIDLDPIFNLNLDEDYDYRASGITRASFCSIYHSWVSHCGLKRDDLYKQKGDKLFARDSALVSLCFGLSLVGRRTLGTASHNTVSNVEFFLFGLHALFKGDFRITCVRDEWVFSDMSLLHSVLAPAVKMALKLHQDHFMAPEEYCSCQALYTAINCHTECLVICHEASPTWRNNVLRGAPHLLALRHVMDDGTDEYKVIMLNKRYLSFRVIKLNRECVRGLWAGQQQELIYLRNRNPERGSIQNAKQALRNIINSSCDQPIGYPIYVSPLTTSYAETNPQLTTLIGGSLTLSIIKRRAIDFWTKVRRRCGEGCSSGSASNTIESGNNPNTAQLSQITHRALDVSRTSLGTRGSLASVGKPGSSTLASLAGLLGSREQPLAPTNFQVSTDQPLSSQRLFFERQDSDSVYTTIRESSDKINTNNEREPSQHDGIRNTSTNNRGSWRHSSNASHYSRDSRQNISTRERAWDIARRSKERRDRERIRPSSFRFVSTPGREGVPKSSHLTNEGYEMSSLKSDKTKEKAGHSRERDGKTSGAKEGRKDHKSSGSKSIASATSFPSPESSMEDLSFNVGGGDNCQIIFNRNANSKHSNSFDQPKESHKRRSSDFACSSGRELSAKHHNSEKNIDNIASKDLPLKNMESCSEHSVFKRSGESPRELTKTTKDLRLDRENYKELAGKYSELSIKETNLKIASDTKDTGRKPIVRRSESLKSELKNHISVGCKVVIVDPSGVYDCINLGRRIDVKWPSPYQRQRGGRNHWGTWVPQQGMDGQVVHRWTPNHRDPDLRSHVDKTILLVQIDDKFVPIAENCVQDLGDEV